MIKISAYVVAAAVAALSVGATASMAQTKREQSPTARDPAQETQGRRPAQPPAGTPPERAVPRPPQRTPQPRAVPRRPPPARPDAGGESRSYVYPYYPLFDFDLVYRFPYGIYPYSRYGYPYPASAYPFPIPGCTSEEVGELGSVRLDISQKDATVYADGYYVGVVEDFDGPLQHLNLSPGPHHIEVRAPRFETLGFDVFLQPGRTVTYRSALEPLLR